MRRLIRVTPLLILAAFLCVGGCQKVNVSKDYPLNPGDIKVIIVDAPVRDQDASVTVDSTGPIDVYIAAMTDAEEANEKVQPPKNP